MLAAAEQLGTEEDRMRNGEDAATFDAIARDFADTVDRENQARQTWNGAGARAPLLSYADAVVLHGNAAVFAAPAADYTATPIYFEARAGGDVHTIRGADVLLLLTEPDDEAALNAARERLGLQ
jgi:hypothetical protein